MPYKNWIQEHPIGFGLGIVGIILAIAVPIMLDTPLPPTALIQMDSPPYHAGIEIKFTGAGSTPNNKDGTIEKYEWRFGDGTVKTDRDVSHIYLESNFYSVTLTVTNDDGLSNTYKEAIEVKTNNSSDVDDDGIPDFLDDCPNKPETTNGYNDSDGCPDTKPNGGVMSLDSDNDGIIDDVDQCPNEKETINGFKDEDGCPDFKPSSNKIIISPGSSIPDCENNNSCYIPFERTINVGNTVLWSNEDTAQHTVTSGTLDRADGMFDSGLFGPGKSFEYTFDQSGTYDYFCMLHPWAKGIVVVK